MQPVRFHLDESVTTRIAKALRQRDRDCTTPKGVGLMEAADSDQLAFALEEKRVLITRDRDFLIFHDEGLEHAGIIYWNSKRHFGQIVRMIDLLASRKSADELYGTIVFI